MSQNNSQRNRSTQDTRSSQSSTGSDRTYVPLGHNDENSPRTQAWRETPPSSQQYSSWSRDQRNEYREEVVRNATRSLTSEIETLRDGENWWRERYNTAFMEGTRSQHYGAREGRDQRNVARVAAIRTNYRLDSRGSTVDSQRSGSSQGDSQRSRDSDSR